MIRHKVSEIVRGGTFRNTIFVFSGNSFGLVFAFLYTLLLGIYLTKSDFGYYSAIFSILLLVSDIADIGIGTSLSRFLPPLRENREKFNSFLKSSFALQGGIALSVALIVAAFSGPLSVLVFHDPSIAPLLRVMSIGVFGAVFSNFFMYALSAREQFFRASVVNTAVGIVRVFLLTILFFSRNINLSSTVWMQSMTYILVCILGLVLLKADFLKSRINTSYMKELVSFSSFVGVSRILTSVSGKLDVIMLMAITNDPVQTGIYSIAARLIVLYPLMTGSFSTVIAPRLSRAKGRNEISSFMKKVVLVTLGLIASIFILIIIAPYFLWMLWGDKYIAASGVFRVLLVSMVFFTASVPAVSITVYFIKKPFILSINAMIQLFTVFFGNLLLIPKFGSFGPAYSLIAAYGVTLFITSYMAYSYYRKHRE